MPDIIIVEDNREIGTLLCDFLRKENYTVSLADTGEKALDIFERYGANLLVLDIGLPGVDGFSVCAKIRENSNTHILIASARTDKESTLKGLQIGADDYITKPFKLGVLISRINALLRRAGAFGAADTELCSNGIRVLLLQSQAFKNGEALELTAAEYKLLCLFMHNPNTVLTKGQILDKLWDCDGNYIDSSTLTVYIRRLRMKIEDDPGAPQMLLTVRGMGYKWSVIS